MKALLMAACLICLSSIAGDVTHTSKSTQRPVSDSALREAGMMAAMGRLRVLPSSTAITVPNEAGLRAVLGRALRDQWSTTTGELIGVVRNQNLTPEQWTSLINTLDPLIKAQTTIGDNGRTEIVELTSQIDELIQRIGERSSSLTETANSLKPRLSEAHTLRDIVSVQDDLNRLRVAARALPRN